MTPTTPAPTVEQPPVNNDGDALAAEQAVLEHWRAIEHHDFARAYEYIDPTQFSRSGWIQSHERDGIEHVTVRATPGVVSGDTATVHVTRLVTIQACGRQDWPPTTYDMVRRGGRWLIHKSNLTRPPCT
jgi:hypothetical protein